MRITKTVLNLRISAWAGSIVCPALREFRHALGRLRASHPFHPRRLIADRISARTASSTPRPHAASTTTNTAAQKMSTMAPAPALISSLDSTCCEDGNSTPREPSSSRHRSCLSLTGQLGQKAICEPRSTARAQDQSRNGPTAVRLPGRHGTKLPRWPASRTGYLHMLSYSLSN